MLFWTLLFTWSWLAESASSCEAHSVVANVLLQRAFTQSRSAGSMATTVLRDNATQISDGRGISFELSNISALEKLGHGGELPDRCTHNNNGGAFFPMRKKQRCSGGCPFSQEIPGDKCHKVCVAKENCAQFHPGRSFADPESRRCLPTCGATPQEKIVGCKRCAGVGVCAECMLGFTLVDKGTKCHSLLEGHVPDGVMPVVYAILGFAVMMLVLYVVNLARRPQVNSEVCEQSLQFRDHSKNWYIDDDKSWHRYPLMETNVSQVDVSGQGVILYFRHLTFAIGAALLLFLTCYITFRFSSAKTQEDQAQALTDCYYYQDSAAATEWLKHSAENKQEMLLNDSRCMFISMTVAYLVLLIASSIFEYSQTKLSQSIDELNATHEDYAVWTSGFPKDSTDPNELVEYFQRVLDSAAGRTGMHRIVGCSIAYDYKQNEELISNAIWEWVEELEEQHIREHGSGADRGSGQSQESKDHGCLSASSVASFSFLDFFFWGSCTDEPPEKVDKEEVVEVLKELNNSGYCYVIVEDPATIDFLKEEAMPKAPKFRGMHEIQLSDIASEPQDLYWENFSNMNFWIRLLFGLFMIAVTICLWIGLYMTYASSSSTHASFLEGTLLGFIVTIGNVIVASVIDTVTRFAGFMQKDRRDMAILSLALICTLLNTGFDIWMVFRIAKGITITDAGSGTSQGFDHVVAEEMFAMIVPGYLILPYLVTPFFEHVVPYYLGLWLVRSRKAALRAGEDCLKCPEFDICWRYSDMHNNFTVCTTVLFMLSPRNYQVMAWLVVFLVIVYGIDKYKLLRQTSRTFYTTRRLSETASLWWCIPTGTLAAAATWWACRAGVLPSKSGHLMCIIAFCVHCIVWLCLYRFAHWCARSEEVVETTRYDDMCKTLRETGMMWSYFSTNPIFCLRSKYLQLKEPGSSTFPCVPYVVGKEHLQPGASSHFVIRETSSHKARMKGHGPGSVFNMG